MLPLKKMIADPRLNVAWSCSHAPLDLSVLLKRARQHSRRALFRRQFGQRGLTKTPEVGDEQWCHIAVPLQESCAQGNNLMPAACEHGIGQAHSRERAHVRACGSPSGLG